MIIELIVAMVTLTVAIVKVFPNDRPDALPAAGYKKRKTNNSKEPAAHCMHNNVPTHDYIVVWPGTAVHCGFCHKPVCNMYQHLLKDSQCPMSAYYWRLQKAMASAYVYLRQRYLDHPLMYQSPGGFVMFSVEFVKVLVEKFPLSLLTSQEEGWNVLMDIDIGRIVKGRAAMDSKTFFDYVSDAMDIFYANQCARGDLTMYRCNERGTLIEEWTFEHQFGGHEKMALTHEVQDMMEKNRRNIVGKYGKDDTMAMMYCLPCVTKAEYQGAKDATIPYLKM